MHKALNTSEILQIPQLPNPPVWNFNPRETNPKLKKLRPGLAAQLLAVQWMETHRELGACMLELVAIYSVTFDEVGCEVSDCCPNSNVFDIIKASYGPVNGENVKEDFFRLSMPFS